MSAQLDRVLQAAGEAPVDGATLLTEVYKFLSRFVAYPSAHAAVAHVLWIAHTHLMEVWESTPRIAFLSPEPSSGKTRALEVTELLVPRPVEAVNATPAYLFRKVSDPSGLPTVLFDEIDTLFGAKAKEHEELRGILNAGHRRGAVAGRCVVRGTKVETEELPAYCAVAIAGLGGLPDTILTRSVVVKMRRRAPQEVIEPYRRRVHSPEGHRLRERLVVWAAQVAPRLAGEYPEMPDGVADRNADVWEALLGVADTAGSQWPAQARVAAVAIVAAARETPPSLGVRLLRDLHLVFGDLDELWTETLISKLCELDEAPWGDLRGKPIDSRTLAKLLREYGVQSRDIRIGEKVRKGYDRATFADVWSRYLAPTLPVGRATSATSATTTGKVAHNVTDVADKSRFVAEESTLQASASSGRVAVVADVALPVGDGEVL